MNLMESLQQLLCPKSREKEWITLSRSLGWFKVQGVNFRPEGC